MSKVPVSIRMDEGVVERLRNAVWHLGRGLTVTSIVEEAVEKALHGLESRTAASRSPIGRHRYPERPVSSSRPKGTIENRVCQSSLSHKRRVDRAHPQSFAGGVK